MEKQQAHTAGEQKNGGDSERAEYRGERGRRHEQPLWDGARRGPAEAVHGDEEDAEHDRPEAVERTAHERRDAKRGIGQGEHEHHEEPREDEARASEQGAPPAASGVPQKDPELRGCRAREHVHQRQALEKSLPRYPPSLFL